MPAALQEFLLIIWNDITLHKVYTALSLVHQDRFKTAAMRSSIFLMSVFYLSSINVNSTECIVRLKPTLDAYLGVIICSNLWGSFMMGKFKKDDWCKNCSQCSRQEYLCLTFSEYFTLQWDGWASGYFMTIWRQTAKYRCSHGTFDFRFPFCLFQFPQNEASMEIDCPQFTHFLFLVLFQYPMSHRMKETWKVTLPVMCAWRAAKTYNLFVNSYRRTHFLRKNFRDNSSVNQGL